MKKIVLILMGFVIALVSCTPSAATADENDITDSAEDLYYVKYASNGLEGTYSATYTDESGKSVSLSSIKGADFERTIGPVSTGYKANFHIMSTLNYTTISLRIEIKKGNDPFVVKNEAVRTSSGSPCMCSVSYTIE